MGSRSQTAGAAPPAAAADKVRISGVMNNVVTIVYQNKAAALFDGRLDLSKLTYKSNLGGRESRGSGGGDGC